MLYFPLILQGQVHKNYNEQIHNSFDRYEYKKVIKIYRENKNLFDSKTRNELSLIIGKSFENLNKEDSAFYYFQTGLYHYKLNKTDDKIAEYNLALYLLLDSQNNLNLDKDIYFNKIVEYAEKSENKKWNAIVNNNIAIRNFDVNPERAKIYFKKAYQQYGQINDADMEAMLLSNLGLLYTLKFENADSSRYFLNKAKNLFENKSIKINTKFNVYNNIGVSFKNEKKYENAIEYFKLADSLEITKYRLKNKKILYTNLEACYYYLKDYKKAYDYLYECDSIKDIINLKAQNTLITDIEERYQNQKLRADNLETEAKRKQTQNIAIGLAGSLVLGSIIAFLLFKNTKRKQLLAEQDKALETQKLTTVLKEQELKSIDAMIEGQEKERQRIANDLHDDLGGLMATVKLHFNALKEKQTPELYDKTNQLIDDAYHKVRTVAHAKNSGVIAKQGLLKAINEMAEKISVSNTLVIDVIDHGLENRLENSLELTIFRIVQELITNIIKHANATEATIHITNHDDSLNIMVEDNGIGFNPSQLTKTKKGMGISSIDKRIEHLNGTMTIESEINKGSTIIIDIPI